MRYLLLLSLIHLLVLVQCNVHRLFINVTCCSGLINLSAIKLACMTPVFPCILALRFRLTNPNDKNCRTSYRFVRVARQSYLFNKELYVRNTMPDKVALSVDMSHQRHATGTSQTGSNENTLSTNAKQTINNTKTCDASSHTKRASATGSLGLAQLNQEINKLATTISSVVSVVKELETLGTMQRSRSMRLMVNLPPQREGAISLSPK